MLYAIDIETALIVPGLLTPPVACMSAAWQGINPVHVGLRDAKKSIEWLRRALSDPSISFVLHNGAFDFACLAAEAGDEEFLRLVFDAYDAGRVHDTMIRQMLADIAHGEFRFAETDEGTKAVGYALDDLAYRHLGVRLDKEGPWRLNYHELIGKPIEDWPEGAREYAKKDAEATYHIFCAQEQEYAAKGWLINEAAQTRAAFALQLTSAWGIRTSSSAIVELKNSLEKRKNDLFRELVKDGLISSAGKRNTKVAKAMILEGYAKRGEKPPQTEKGDVSTSEESVKGANDPRLKRSVDYAHIQKLESTYLEKLRAGEVHPINPKFNVLVETGRTSGSAQQQPREPGVREVHVPRAGFLYCSVDYNYLELCTLAQACIDLLGGSTLAEVINAGEDPHVKMASEMLGITFEEGKKLKKSGDPEFKETRQTAKILNFGLPGGLGVDSLVGHMRKHNVFISRDEAARLKGNWFKAWPEMPEYFKRAGDATVSGSVSLVQLRSLRVRKIIGSRAYSQWCNSWFQGLAADGAKAALWKVSRECYVEPSSALYGSRSIVFMHDEILAEVPEWRAHDAAYRLRDVMVTEMQRFVPNVKVNAEPALMRAWSKFAEPVFDANKKLIAWEDREKK